MKTKKTRSIRINLEFKECGLSTGASVPSSFSSVQIQHVSHPSREVKIFLPEFTPLQEQPLQLIGVERRGNVLAGD